MDKDKWIEYLEQLKNCSFKETPTYFFYRELKNNILKATMFSQSWSDSLYSKIMANLDVNLRGLGSSYKPHEDFLKKSAKIFADIIIKFVSETAFEFDEDWIVSKCKEISFHIN